METNPIRLAMRIVGGTPERPEGRPEHVAAICNVSSQTVYNWIKDGFLRDARHAVALARATLEKGAPLSVAVLCGVEPVGTGGAGGPGSNYRAKRAFQKEARVLGLARASKPSSGAATLLVQPVHGRVPAVRQMRSVQPQRQVHARVPQAAGHVLQRLTAA